MGSMLLIIATILAFTEVTFAQNVSHVGCAGIGGICGGFANALCCDVPDQNVDCRRFTPSASAGVCRIRDNNETSTIIQTVLPPPSHLIETFGFASHARCAVQGDICGGFAPVRCCREDNECKFYTGADFGECIPKVAAAVDATPPSGPQGIVPGHPAPVPPPSSTTVTPPVSSTMTPPVSSTMTPPVSSTVTPSAPSNNGTALLPSLHQECRIGGRCGGFAGIACCNQLVCQYDPCPSPLGCSDIAGHCVPRGHECSRVRQRCFGYEGTPCCRESGLYCHPDHPGCPDCGGTCRFRLRPVIRPPFHHFRPPFGVFAPIASHHGPFPSHSFNYYFHKK